MENTKKALTVADLIARKEEIKSRSKATATLYVESLDAEITITELAPAIIGEAMQMDVGGDEYGMLYGVTEPNLRDPELQAAFKCAQPTEIVNHLFKPGEIKAVTTELMKLSGYGDGAVRRVDGKLKN